MKSLAKKIIRKAGIYSLMKSQWNKIAIAKERRRKEELFEEEFTQFQLLSRQTKERFPLSWENRMPLLDDKTSTTPFDRHYTYHPAWAARVLKRIQPKEHVDISSILHFSTLVSAFIPVKFYDYRPAQVSLSNLKCQSADLTNLPFENNSIESISCMHTVEHVGLGRYGDPLDYDGDLKAINELKRVVAVNGNLLFVVPIGKPVILFNGHRIYSFGQIINYFKGFELKEFALIPDEGNENGLIENATEEMADKQSYGCGCFWFIKSANL